MENQNVISVGIFFDGTGNNGINTTSSRKPEKNSQSYYSAQTNIFKLYELFIGLEKQYVEGIGTLTGEEDSTYAMATCMNPVGYKGYSSDDKLIKAYNFVDKKLNDKSKEYHFYVYGFSRGAMLARAFSYELITNKVKFTQNIKIKFLGVFDTVESTPINLKYNVKLLPEIENALHLCAINECRYFFPLTGIFNDSDKMNDKKTNWKEIFVPGAHADVGGGYLEGPQSVYISKNYLKNESVKVYVEKVRNTKKDSDGKLIWLNLLKDYKIDEGSIYSQAFIERQYVSNDLPRVYGRLMLKESNVVDPIFIEHFTESNFTINGNKHPYLIELSKKLEIYIKDLSPILKPSYDYLKLVDYTHISGNFGLYVSKLLKQDQNEIDVEKINNRLNFSEEGEFLKLLTMIAPVDNLKENDFQLNNISDIVYGPNIPNNDTWSRLIYVSK